MVCKSITTLGMAFLLSLMTGCTTARPPAKLDAASPAKCDRDSLPGWVRTLADAILSHPFPSPGEPPPVVVELGIVNRTSTRADTVGLADALTSRLAGTGRMRFVTAAQRDALLREKGLQLGDCTDEVRIKMGRQLGAKYMLTGSLTELTRVSPPATPLEKADVRYRLTIEIADLETGLVVLRKPGECNRDAGQPLAGW